MLRGILIMVVLCVFVRCSENDDFITPIFYRPPVYLAGYFNGDYDSLTGNLSYRNSCNLVGDTIRMYFYSSDFHEENKVWQGDLIRMDIYPGNTDSIVGRARILFHMARYHERNISYTITPIDTLYGVDRISIHVNNINRSHHGTIDIDDLFVGARPILGTSGEYLEILKGRIRGHIE